MLNRALRSGRVTKVTLCFLTVLIAVVPVGLAFHFREPELLKWADMVSMPRPFEECRWLSDHELLFTEYYPGTHFDRFDLSTGKTQAVPILDQLVPERHRMDLQASPDGNTDVQVSPDGKWVLWNERYESNERYNRKGTSVTLAVSLDGSSHREYTVGTPIYDTGWMADSHHWIQFMDWDDRARGMTRAIIRDVQAPEKSTRFLFPASYHVWGSGIVTRSNHWLQCDFESQSTVSPNVRIDEFQILPCIKPLRTLNIRLPFRAEVRSVRPSPAGDRIVWHCVQRLPPSEMTRLLHRFIPGILPYKRIIESFWVSRLDGSELRELGYRMERPTGSLAVDEMGDLTWLPSGKQLSFNFEGALYTIPAD